MATEMLPYALGEIIPTRGATLYKFDPFVSHRSPRRIRTVEVRVHVYGLTESRIGFTVKNMDDHGRLIAAPVVFHQDETDMIAKTAHRLRVEANTRRLSLEEPIPLFLPRSFEDIPSRRSFLAHGSTPYSSHHRRISSQAKANHKTLPMKAVRNTMKSNTILLLSSGRYRPR
jgi:hypothetical protein